MGELRIIIADDHELIRRGLRDLLAGQAGWQVIGEASNGSEAVELAVKLKPDIAILDFFMPGLNGPQAAAQITETLPSIGCVILTMDDSEGAISEVLRAGVRAMVLKSDANHDLLEAVKAVEAKRHFFAPGVSQTIVDRLLSEKRVWGWQDRATKKLLTQREIEVMRLLAQGMSSREMAQKLQISTRTVESHRSNINSKLSLSSVADLVRYAIRNRFVTFT